MYIRKTKDIYILFWNGEEIDTAETKAEAQNLKKEYQMAFKSNVSIIKRRIKKDGNN